MVKIPDIHLWLFFANFFRQQHQLVILHPDNIVVLDKGEGFFAKECVDLPVCFPVFGFVLNEREKIMTKRPDCAVAVAFVIIFNLFAGQKNRMIIQLVQLFRNLLFFIFVIHMDSRPSHPMHLCIGFQ